MIYLKEEFRAMIVKMTPKSQKQMEAWIEKIQEMFNKDIKELKNSDQQQNK